MGKLVKGWKTDYFQSPNDIFDLHDIEGLTYKGILVYLYLCRRANDNMSSWPKKSTIAKHTRLSESGVTRGLRELKNTYLVVVQDRYTDKGRQTSNLYTLVHPRDAYRALKGEIDPAELHQMFAEQEEEDGSEEIDQQLPLEEGQDEPEDTPASRGVNMTRPKDGACQYDTPACQYDTGEGVNMTPLPCQYDTPGHVNMTPYGGAGKPDGTRAEAPNFDPDKDTEDKDPFDKDTERSKVVVVVKEKDIELLRQQWKELFGEPLSMKKVEVLLERANRCVKDLFGEDRINPTDALFHLLQVMENVNKNNRPFKTSAYQVVKRALEEGWVWKQEEKIRLNADWSPYNWVASIKN